MKIAVLASLLSISIASANPEFRSQPDPGTLRSPAVTEASGLAASPTDPRFLWVVNDSGDTARIHLFQIDGTPRGILTIDHARNIDWEDLASFQFHGRSYLLIADTGDNSAVRKSRTLYLVGEPPLPEPDQNLDLHAKSLRTITFSLPGNTSADIESIAFDPRSQNILFLTKRTLPPELHSIPFLPQKDPVISTRITNINVSTPASFLIPFASQPTGMAISADGSEMAIVTYFAVFIYHRGRENDWAATLSAGPVQILPHALPQAESVTFAPDSKSIFAISEAPQSPIRLWQK